jgi:REP element-mobilizing transposase RayT
MVNDPGSVPMSDPLAFFLTWTTYGSWLPGDSRGWAEKPGRFREPSIMQTQTARGRLTEPVCTLDPDQRDVVEKTIVDHCRIRSWHLHAVNCRTQHVHVVVTAPNHDPDDVMDQVKAWCTRRLKEYQISEPEAQAKDVQQVAFEAPDKVVDTARQQTTALQRDQSGGCNSVCRGRSM